MATEIPPEMVDAINGSGDLLMADGVFGIDIGLAEDGALVLRVLVGDLEDPPEVPDSIGGFPVIMIEGTPRIEYTVVPDAAKHDPVMGGHQVGRRDVHIDPSGSGLAATGTLGCVFRDLSTGEPVALSNAHVLCGNPGTPPFAAGDVIQQPAPSIIPAAANERLGELIRWDMPADPASFTVPSLNGLGGFFDAAICSIATRTPNIGEVEEIGRLTGIATAVPGDVVRKRGARTRLTWGIVTGVWGVRTVFDDNGSFLWWMFNQITIARIPDPNLNPDDIWSDSGDSGSVVVNDRGQIVGLHHSGDTTQGYANDFPSLAATLGITL